MRKLRLQEKITTMDMIGLGGIMLVFAIGVIFVAKEWGLI